MINLEENLSTFCAAMAAAEKIKLQTNQLTMKLFFVSKEPSKSQSYQCLQKEQLYCLCLGFEQATQKKSECSDLRSEIIESKSSKLQSEAIPAQCEATPEQY